MEEKEISTHPLKDQRQNPSNTPSPAVGRNTKKEKATQKLLRYTELHTLGKNMRVTPYPCCVLPQIAAFVLDSVGVPKLLKELHLFNDVLPFLHANTVRLRGKNNCVVHSKGVGFSG